MNARVMLPIAVLQVGFFGAVKAETIAWWRMEGKPGASLAEQAAESPSDDLLAEVKGGDAKYGDPFSAPLLDADRNDASAYFGNNDNLSGSYLRVPDDSRLRPEGDFTLELFFKWSGRYTLASGATAGLAGKIRATPVSCTYGIGLSGNMVVARFYTGQDELLEVSGKNPCDGLWHHVAVTYVEAERRASLWFDYKMCKTMTLAGSLQFARDTPFMIASVGLRTFSGWIDEVRVSDRALTAGDFLQGRIPARSFLSVTDPGETAYRYRFDELQGYAEAKQAGSGCGWYDGLPTQSERVNAADIYRGFLVPDGNTVPEIGADVPAAVIYPKTCLTNAIANASSAFFSNGGIWAAELSDPDELVREDFTAECHFKLNETSPWTRILGQRSGYGDNSSMPMLWAFSTQGDGSLNFMYACTNGAPSAQYISVGGNYGDGEWHQLAVSYLSETHTVRLYFDHLLKVEQQLEHALVGVSKSSSLVMGRRSGGMNGCLDEVRITKRALGHSPDEMIGVFSNPQPEAGEAILHVGFNGTWNVASRFPSIRAAVPSALEVVGGAVPEFATDIWGSRVYEGRDAASFSANTACAHLNRGKVTIVDEHSRALEQKAFTVETFVKFPAGSALRQYANVMEYFVGGSSVWKIRIDGHSHPYVILFGVAYILSIT